MVWEGAWGMWVVYLVLSPVLKMFTCVKREKEKTHRRQVNQM